MEGGRQEAIARREAMVEDLRKAELVRDRLESFRQSARAYPEGHDMRVLVEGLPVDQALRAVEQYIRTLRETSSTLAVPKKPPDFRGSPLPATR